MLAKYEIRKYESSECVWVGKYKNLHNISHWHTEHELIACQQGRASVMIEDQRFQILQGQCLFCTGGSVHFIDADEDCILMVCLFDAKPTENITTEYKLASPLFDDNYMVLQRLTDIYQELCCQPPFYEERTAAMMSQLVVDIFRSEPLESASSAPANAALTRYKQLLNFIDQHFDSITFEEAASYMCLSEAYFSKYFKRQAGMNFSHYLNVVRIEKAVNFLKDDNNLRTTDIMLKCGFNTIRNFNRIFKEITGYPPKKLPQGYTLNVRTLKTIQGDFDPTLNTSVLL